MLRHEAVSTIYRPKDESLSFFKFLQKKVSRLPDNRSTEGLPWLAYGADWETSNFFVTLHYFCSSGNDHTQNDLASPNPLHKPAR